MFKNIHSRKEKKMARKKIEDVKAVEESAVIEEPVKEIVEEIIELEEPVVIKEDYYRVFEYGEEIGEYPESDKKLSNFQGENLKELQKLLVDWAIPFNDVDLLLYNLGSLGQHYRSWTQYRVQNGLAPLEPAIRNMIQYYRVALNELDYSDEEVIVAVHKFRYSFLLCD
jgi:hypothetical protein